MTGRCPLCVDLDGTLVRSDTFLDSLVLLARRHPVAFLRVPFWLLKGKAFVKSQVASRVALEVADLQFNLPLLRYLRDEHAAGRQIYLVTGADRVIATKIAIHLNLFHEVLASNGVTNLTGSNKLQELTKRFTRTGFDYVGNALPDLVLLQEAREAMVANPHRRLKRALKRGKIPIQRTFMDRIGIYL